ncbi:putative transcriptional regulator, XRE family [Parafrankia sp. EAN1pec]|uniref:helix-turn-helix domain-containing protein n=1 Tax=Parafrankia sp. (strain EAN1pec) TaxID=298653 RepID=UPI00005425B2|nr:putative transcriptional regulator, XRE family [Frankia sp. EAN1pec]
MTAKLDYRWRLREVMAGHGMFSTTDLGPLLAQRGIVLSPSQVYRLVTDKPERLSLRTLMALLDILGCAMDDLIEPVAASGAGRGSRRVASGSGPVDATGETGVGDLRPRRARVVTRRTP